MAEQWQQQENSQKPKPRVRQNSNQVIFKIIIVGNAGVGKSCLLNRFTKNEFTNEYNATIGVEFQSQLVQIDPKTKIRMQIWDTCGQESFQSIVRSFYRNSTAVFIVYNISDQSSFDSINQWYNEAQNNALENSVFVLVGAQKDRESERVISFQQGEQFMKDKKMHLFFETSAVDGTNIEKAFQEAGKLIFLNYANQKLKQLQNQNDKSQLRNEQTPSELQEEQNGIKLSNDKSNKKKKSKGCC